MLTLIDTPPFLDAMEQKAKQLAAGIAEAMAGRGQVLKVFKRSELLAASPASLIHILKGVFRCQHGDKTIRLYSGGDLLLAPGAGESGGLSVTSEFGAEIQVVGREEFVQALSADHVLLADWLDYQSLETRIGHLLCSLYIAEDVKHDPEIRQYAPGEVIIQEDAESKDVYEMVQGKASVRSKGVDLAVVREGEVFGELSFFTGLNRTATVTALQPCMVQVIDQRQFLRVMKYRPVLVDGLLRTLCQRLVDLNQRVAGAGS